MSAIRQSEATPQGGTVAMEDGLLTEAVHPGSLGLDGLSTLAIVELMNAEDVTVIDSVRSQSERIAAAIEAATQSFRSGGRLIYVGAGTSGRLGVLDASECPPTFGTDPAMVVGVIAGGRDALTRAIEGAEDRRADGALEMDRLEIGPSDLVVGIAASGRTPFVLGAIDRARELRAVTAGVACNRPSLLGQLVDIEISPIVGPEVLAGSTRLKAGTATKMILNMISTGAMIRVGKTYGNRMIDLLPSNEKLRLRSRRILREVAGVDDVRAIELLAEAKGRLKAALVAALAGVPVQEADRRLRESGGRVAEAVAWTGEPKRHG